MKGKTYPNKGDLVIGNDVWISHHATMMAGIAIGDGAIIATNATVVKDVALHAIVGDNPAQEIKKRVSEEKINQLLNIKWWDWPIEKITKNVRHLTGNPIDNLMQ